MEHLEVLVNIMVVVRIISLKVFPGNDFDQVFVEQRDINRFSMGVRFWLESSSCVSAHAGWPF